MIHQDEWLAQAKRLAVGMRVRIHHRRERRANMVIANDPDKWWCYCQACKEGGVVDKEHVLLGVGAMKPSTDMTEPHDVETLDGPHGRIVVDYLVRKHIDPMYIRDPIGYSPSRRRIIIQNPQTTLGRDITDKSNAKWLAYKTGTPYLTTGTGGRIVVVVEDAFSWYKARFSCLGMDIDFVCALGTTITDKLALHLLKFDTIVWCFDGDAAGGIGAHLGCTRMRAMGKRSAISLPPTGLDPKDLDLDQIRSLILKGVQDANASS